MTIRGRPTRLQFLVSIGNGESNFRDRHIVSRWETCAYLPSSYVEIYSVTGFAARCNVPTGVLAWPAVIKIRQANTPWAIVNVCDVCDAYRPLCLARNKNTPSFLGQWAREFQNHAPGRSLSGISASGTTIQLRRNIQICPLYGGLREA